MVIKISNMIYLASDHKGYELKGKIKVWLRNWGYEFGDLGPSAYVADDDYPDYVSKVGEQISAQSESLGIVLGFTGEGEAIVCNKYFHVRTAVYNGGTKDIIKLSREHNDANVLSLGAGFVNEVEAKEALKLWLDTKFSGEERHVRRLKKIEAIESANFKKLAGY